MLAWKGVDLAIRAVEAVGANVRLTVVGDGPFLEPAKQIARELKVVDRVDFRGALSRQEAIRVFAEHHALLFPSLHDTGGLVILEAMANGLPVICLDRGGPAEAVEDGCGVRLNAINPRQTVQVLTEAVARYDTNRDLLELEGANAKSAVLRKYEWNHKGRSMAELYDRVRAN
jgi:glycosyltransferase involved in cell wall biosynthesis